MITERSTISKKYALAFLKHYNHEVKATTVQTLEAFVKYIQTRPDIFAYINLSTVPEPDKHKLHKTVLDILSLGDGFRALMKLLYKHKRISILGAVLSHIIYLYYKKHQQMTFKVWTSHVITDQERSSITTLIQHNVPSVKIITHFFLDHTLICGIRIKSNSLFWENSIAKQLNDLEWSLLKKAHI